MNASVTMASIASDKLFVIACPVCRGHVAAPGSLCGRDACCPLCASLFHVPFLEQPADAVTAAPPEPALAEDWGRVISTLIPPPAKPEPVPQQPESTSDFELAPDLIPEPTPVVPPETKPSPPEALVDLIPMEPLSVAVTEPSVAPMPGAGAPTDWIDQVLESSDLPEAPGPSERLEGFPHLGAALHVPADQDLAFREPVRTIRQGDSIIEIRRLTPEERKARRFRRNLMMIVVGVSILLAIVVIFGVPQQPPR